MLVLAKRKLYIIKDRDTYLDEFADEYELIATGKSGDPALCRRLIPDDETPAAIKTFIEACKYGNINAMDEIIKVADMYPDDDQVSDMVLSGVEWAARRNHDHVIHYIIESFSVFHHQELYNCVLYGACKGGNHKLIDWAIEKGAEIIHGSVLKTNMETIIKMMKLMAATGLFNGEGGVIAEMGIWLPVLAKNKFPEVVTNKY